MASEDNFKHFFNGDERSSQFVYTMFDGSSDYTRCKLDSDIKTKNSHASLYIYAKDYEGNKIINGVKQEDDHIHQEYVDMIVIAANYHKKLDTRTERLRKDKKIYNIEPEKDADNFIKNNIIGLSTDSDGEYTNMSDGMINKINELLGIKINPKLWEEINTPSILRNEIMEELREKKINASSIPEKYKTLEDSEAFNFFEKVYGNWKNLTIDEKNFYSNVVGLYAKKSATELYIDTYKKYDKDISSIEGQWVKLSDQDITNLEEIKIDGTDRQNLRINLLTYKNNEDMSLFQSCLPIVKGEGKFWITTKNGVKCYSYNNARIFSEIYSGVYKGTVDSDGGIKSQINLSKDPTDIIVKIEIKKDDFNIKPAKKIQKALQIDEMRTGITEDKVMDNVNGKLDYGFLERRESYIDIPFNNKWEYCPSRKQYYKYVNGNKEYYNENSINDKDTCYGSYLKGEEKQCKRFINCISDADDISMARCLDVLKDKDMYDVAKDDIQNVSIGVVKRALAKLGFKKYKVSGKIQTYKEWENSVLVKKPENVINAINSNTKLQEYIRGLVTFYNHNLVKHDDKTSKTTKYASNLGKHRFRHVVQNEKGRVEDIVRALSSLTNSNPSSLNPGRMLDPMISGMLSNVQPTNHFAGVANLPIDVSQVVMMGGSISLQAEECIESNTCSGRYKKMYNDIVVGLADVGVTLSEKDKSNMSEFFKKMEINENSLVDLLKVLNAMVSVARSYNISLNFTDDEDMSSNSVLRLDQLKTKEDIVNYLRKHISEIRKRIKDNTSQNVNSIEMLFSDTIGKMIVPSALQKNRLFGNNIDEDYVDPAGELVSLSEPLN